MELRHLRYFEAVATAGNFTKAAQHLGIAQPPLSRQIRELEAEMGVELLHRGSRPVRLTPAGRLFYEQAAQILAGAEQLKQSMQRYVARGRRRFVVGFVGSILYGAMPNLIRAFRAHCSEIDLHLLEMTTLQQVAALHDGRIDVGLGRIRIDDAAIHREVLHEERLIAAVSERSRWALVEAPVALADLATETLLVYPNEPRPSYADQVLALFRDHGTKPAQIREVREVQTALGLVAAEFGIALVPESIGHMVRDGVLFRTISDKRVTSPIILSRRDGDRSDETRLFEALARSMWPGI